MSYPPPPGPPLGAPDPSYGAGQYQPYAQDPGQGQPSRPHQPAPATSKRPLILAAVAGFVVAAVIAGVLVAAGAFDDSDSSDGPSTASVSLPGKIGSYVAFENASRNTSEQAKKAVANAAEVQTRTAQSLSAAHHGAGAAVRNYVSEDLQTQFQIWAVRDETPRPVVPYQNADYLGLAQPTTVVRQYGDVYCQLFAVQTTPKGKTPAADSYTVTGCVRSDDDLSVIYTGGGSSAFSRNPGQVADLVDQVWDELD